MTAGILPDMGNNLKTLRETRKWTHDEAAAAFGMSRGGYIKLERGERKLDSDRIELAARIYGVAQDEVFQVPLPAQKQERARLIPNAALGGDVAITHKIPAYGHAVGGRYGQFILNGNRMQDVLAPASLANVRDAYAVYIVGHSMEPRYFAGEAVFVNPRAPIRPGDFVVAQIATDDEAVHEAYVKQYLGQDAREIRLGQFKPKKTLRFPARKVVSVHRIIMGGDG